MSEKDTQRKQTFISHRILSWCGDHKMKVIAIAILLVASGVVLHLPQEECPHIQLALEWAKDQESTQVEGAHGKIPQFQENQPMELIIKLATTNPGKLNVVIENEVGTPVTFSESENGPWSNNLLLMQTTNLIKPVSEVEMSIWVKSAVHPQGFDCGLLVKASLDSCQSAQHLYFTVLETPAPNSSTPPPDGPCSGTGQLVTVIFIGIIITYINQKRK